MLVAGRVGLMAEKMAGATAEEMAGVGSVALVNSADSVGGMEAAVNMVVRLELAVGMEEEA